MVQKPYKNELNIQTIAKTQFRECTQPDTAPTAP